MYRSLVDMLRTNADRKGDDVFCWYLLDGEDDELIVSYAELDRSARAVAARLSSEGRPGDRVVVLMAPGPSFTSAFFGCLYAGMIAVPAFLPDVLNAERSLPRLRAIAADADAVCILTDELFAGFQDQLWAIAPELARTSWVLVEDALTDDEASWSDPGTDGSETAFIQYTSGSTSLPKGVMLSHDNLLANSELIRRNCPGEDLVMASWLPPYHDMGLIGGILQPMYRSGRVALMSPLDFLSRPSRWLRAISKYSAHVSPAPNFAFELCVRRVSEEEREGLDLSSWTSAFNGAEPVRPSTIRRFTEAFEPYGFSADTMLPCYGLAEVTLFVSGARPLVHSFDRDKLAGGQAVVSDDPRASVELVACGAAEPLHDIRIVDPESCAECDEATLGEIWLAGPSCGQGYWGRPRQTRETFQAVTSSGDGPFVRTGDLGFMYEGQLYVAGRIKDVMIVRGRNIYPQDLELTIESVPGVRAGCVAAFSVEDPDGSTEGIGIVAEVNDAAHEDLDAVVTAVRAAVVDSHQLAPTEVVLIRARTLPKTSSGKVQRHAAKQQLAAGELQLAGSAG